MSIDLKLGALEPLEGRQQAAERTYVKVTCCTSDLRVAAAAVRIYRDYRGEPKFAGPPNCAVLRWGSSRVRKNV